VTVLGLTFQQWPVLNRTLELPFQLFLLTQYLFLLAAGVVLARYTVRNRSDVPAGQAITLGLGIGTPVIVNGSLVAGIMPPELNLTDVAVGVTAVAFAVAVFRYRMLDFAPVGRQQVVETMTGPDSGSPLSRTSSTHTTGSSE
jgi:phosphatidylserine synthase